MARWGEVMRSACTLLMMLSLIGCRGEPSGGKDMVSVGEDADLDADRGGNPGYAVGMILKELSPSRFGPLGLEERRRGEGEQQEE